MKNIIALSALTLLAASTTPAHAGLVFGGGPIKVKAPYHGNDGSDVWARWDSQFRVTEAWGTSNNGVGHHLSIDWDHFRAVYDEAGKPSFVSEITINGEEIVLHESSGPRDLYFKVDCTNIDQGGNQLYYRREIYENGALISTPSPLPGRTPPAKLHGAITLAHQAAFGYAWESRTGYFANVVSDIRTASTLAIQEEAGGDPVKEAEIVVRKYSSGRSLTKGIVLGLIAGAVVGLSGGTAVLVGWAVFGTLETSLAGDAIDFLFDGLDDQTGGGGGGNGSGTGGGGGANVCRNGFEDIVMVETGQIVRICKAF